VNHKTFFYTNFCILFLLFSPIVFLQWAPDVIKVVYKGIPDDRKRLYKEHVESGQLNVLLTTYEYIMKDKSSLRKLPWQYIIVDEGHRMKNAQSKFAQILGTVYTSKHRVLLTGAFFCLCCVFVVILFFSGAFLSLG